MAEYTVGQTAKLYVTYAKDSVPIDPTNPQITIYFGDTIIVGPTSLTQISTGYYYYDFSIPDGQALGVYSALYTGIINGKSFQEAEEFTIIESFSQDSPSLPSDAYCQLVDVQNEMLGIDTSDISGMDNKIINYIPMMEQRINRLTHRTFNEKTVTVYLNGNDNKYLVLPYTPVSAVSSCILRVTTTTDWLTFNNIAIVDVIDEDGIAVATSSTDAEVQACDLLIEAVTGIMKIPAKIVYAENTAYPFWNYTFKQGENNIKVTYTYGYSSINRPADIKLLCAKMTAIQALMNRGDKDTGGGTSLSVDGYAKSWGSVAYGGRMQILQSEIDEIIRSYRKSSIGLN